jgi:glycosyltransferase involved in cell wall biosynthesis
MPDMRGEIISRKEMLAIPAIETSDMGLIPSDPLVSVIMITYNHEAYIEQAIEGILAQRCDFPIEVIIGEDKSQDRTLEICLAYQKKYPELIRIVTWHENVGSNANLLRVWGRARGKYVAACEGDDYWTDPDKLAKQVALMEQYPDTTLSGARVRVLDSSNADVPGEVFEPIPMKSKYGPEDVIQKPFFHTSTYFFRRSGLEFPACARKVLCMDSTLMAAASVQGSLRCLPDTVSVYRINERGMVSGLSLARKYEVTLELLNAIRTFADEKYFPIIKKKMDTVRMWLCFELVANGQLRRAQGLAWQTVRSLAPHAPRKALVLMFHVYLPRTSQLVFDAWNRCKQGSGAADATIKKGIRAKSESLR